MDGLFALVCASTVVTAGVAVPTSAPAGDNRDAVLATTLAVQKALQQGREHLLHGEYRAAVDALESQLPAINGNQTYLKLLQEAYRRYVQELRLKKQDAEVERYLRRLYILDRGAFLDKAVAGGGPAPPASPAPVASPAAPELVKPQATVRLKSEDDDPFQQSQARTKPNDRAHQLLARAEEEFENRRYREALPLYEQAYEADPTRMLACRERWAYCKLAWVVEQLNHTDAKTNWAELEREIRRALDLAPKLEYGKYLLSEIQTRRTAGTGPAGSPRDPAIAVRHLPDRKDGWLLAESANFRIFHNQAPEFAERVAQVAERTRANLQQKWFGGAGDAWNPKCDLFLYTTAEDYSRDTGQSHSPGHSYLKVESGRLVIRRIYLHSDDANMLTAILPHETTHVVLAGEFGEQLLPRWADEGMAVLTEPRERIERHLENLATCRQAGQVFRLQQLVQFQDQYPSDPRYIRVFYAQSVSLVEYLTNQRGPLTFTQFLHDGLRYGYEKALERNYGYRSFAELEQRWSQHAFDRGSVAGIAQRLP